MKKFFYIDRKIFKYDHPFVKLTASFVVAMLIVYPDKDEQWSDVLFVSTYIQLMLVSMLVSYLVFSWIFMVSVMVVIRFRKEKQARTRWLWQLIAGVLVPFLFSYMCTELYFNRLGIDVQHHYSRNTLPLFALIILCANLVYCYYIDHHTDILKDSTPYATILTVKNGSITYKIPVEQLAYAYHHHNVNWLRFFGKRLEEKIYTDDTLDNIETMLDPGLFNKLNRQFVVNKKAIKEVRREKRSLIFILDPPCEIAEVKTNREKKKELEDWLEGKD